MHGAESLDELGETVDAYRERFALRYRNNHAPNHYPMERVVSGERFHDVIVEVKRTDGPTWTSCTPCAASWPRIARASRAASRSSSRTSRTSSRPRTASRPPSTPTRRAAAVICRLSDLRHVKVNLGFLEMTGYTRDAVVGAQRLRGRRAGQCPQSGPGGRPPERGRDHPADGGLPRPAGWGHALRHRGRPADGTRRRALHALSPSRIWTCAGRRKRRFARARSASPRRSG